MHANRIILDGLPLDHTRRAVMEALAESMDHAAAQLRELAGTAVMETAFAAEDAPGRVREVRELADALDTLGWPGSWPVLTE